MDKIKYNIIKGTIDQYAMFEENITSDVAGIDIQSNVKFNFNPEYRILKCTTSASVWNDSNPILKSTNSLFFELSDESMKSLQTDAEIILPQTLLIHFATLTYGALRGILIAKGNENNVLLPLLPTVDFSTLITTPSIFTYSE